MQDLTPVQRQVLELSLAGCSSTDIGLRLGFTRQRADEALRQAHKRVVTDQASRWATTQAEAGPRRAVHGQFLIRSNDLPRPDGRSGPSEDRCVVWGVRHWPREYEWCWTVSVDRLWSRADTCQAYARWSQWLIVIQDISDDEHPALPELGSDGTSTARYSPVELTKTLAWVMGLRALLYDRGAVLAT